MPMNAYVPESELLLFKSTTTPALETTDTDLVSTSRFNDAPGQGCAAGLDRKMPMTYEFE